MAKPYQENLCPRGPEIYYFHIYYLDLAFNYWKLCSVSAQV